MPFSPQLAEPSGLRHTLARWFAFAALVMMTILWAPLGNTGAYLAMILAGASALLGWRNQVFSLVMQQRWIWLFLLVFVLMAIAFVFNGDPDDWIYIGDFLILPFGIIFAMAFYGLRQHIDAKRLSWLFLLGALAAVIVGSYSFYVSGKVRANGFSNSPIHFANIAVIVGFMALAGTFGTRHRLTPLLYAAPVLGLVAATFTGTRGTYLVAAVLAALFAVFVIARSPGRLAVKLGGIAALLAGLVLAAFIGHSLGFIRPFETLQVVQDILAGARPEDTSSAYRLSMYQAGLRAFLDAPLFGHGWHNQVTAALPYMDDFARNGYAVEKWSYIHNEALGFALSGGILGIVAYVALMLAPLVGLRSVASDRQSVARAYLLCTMILGLFVGGMTDVLFMTELSKTFYVAMTAAILLLCVDRSSRESVRNG